MYTTKDFSNLAGLTGFSETLLNNHFTLYAGYVTNTNKLIDMMKTKEVGTPEYAELHRRFGWEWNGMRLHELYFENLTKEGTQIPAELLSKLERTWGSLDGWKKDFTGMAAMRGIGWVMLVRDNANGELFNVWINEHDAGHLASTTPLLVMDVFEHAYITDYGIKRADYINAFMGSINWTVVGERNK